jgi:hypothetical protein
MIPDYDTVERKPGTRRSTESPAMIQALFLISCNIASRSTRFSGAAGELTAFEEMRKAIPVDAQWGLNKTLDVAALASQVVAARLAPAPADAVPHWRRAVEMQDALTYDEPPAWYYPLRESLAAALLRAGNAAEAERVFRDGVNRSPRNGRMLWGLMESLRAQQKTEESEWVRQEFDAAWAKADVKLKIEEM